MTEERFCPAKFCYYEATGKVLRCEDCPKKEECQASEDREEAKP